MPEKPELVAEFSCPVCGSKERFCESMANEVKLKGWMRQECNFYAQIWQGPVYEKAMAHMIPIGSKVPAYYVYLDVCMGFPDKPCGCVYAVKLERGAGIKTGELGTQPRDKDQIEIPAYIKKAFEGG